MFMAEYEDEIPGASARDCGNYLDMNLPMARYLAVKFKTEVLDQISDEEILTAAEQLRDKERADRRKKYECNSINHTRQGHRKRHADKRLTRICPKISTRSSSE